MKTIINLIDLDCANCADKMQQAVSKIDGIKEVTVNFLTQKMTIDTERQPDKQLIKQIKKACKKIEPDCALMI